MPTGAGRVFIGLALHLFSRILFVIHLNLVEDNVSGVEAELVGKGKGIDENVPPFHIGVLIKSQRLDPFTNIEQIQPALRGIGVLRQIAFRQLRRICPPLST
ncbi:MAG: hypothetical protein MUO68_22180 [Desulfobacteraceae bacterium]|nr:hypothetical protein [Desulfobacteraceae bacterium]